MNVRAALAFLTAVVIAGCGEDYFPGALPITGDQVDAIVNSTVLKPQEKRDQLASYGLDDQIINTLLRDERLANQFGGDLSSALTKVENGDFTSLTPDEVQYFGDATGVTTYSDTEALAIVNFFVDNGISSATQLTDFLDNPANELPSTIDETNLRGVFIDASLTDVRNQLG